MDAEKKQTKRDTILQYAYELCMKKGYNDTKIIDIALASGIGKSTVYEYFESKDAIFAALCEQQLSRYQELAFESQQRCEGKNRREHLKTLLSLEISTMCCHLDHIFQAKETPDVVSGFNPSPMVLFHLEMFKQEAFRKPFLQLIEFRCRLLLSIIQGGIDEGEFRPFPAPLILASVSGSISNFAMLQNNVHPMAALTGIGELHYSTAAYLDFLLDGISMQKTK